MAQPSKTAQTPLAARPTEPVARSLPWSTRAVILVAFAIQFGSVGAGIAASAAASPDAFRLIDGGLLPMLWADASVSGGAVALVGVPESLRAGDVPAGTAAPAESGRLPVCVLLSRDQLPIPPPMVV